MVGYIDTRKKGNYTGYVDTLISGDTIDSYDGEEQETPEKKIHLYRDKDLPKWMKRR